MIENISKKIMMIRNIVMAFFITILILCLIKNTQILLIIDDSIFDRSNLIIVGLILSLSFNNRITSAFLILFAITCLIFEFYPRIIETKSNEYLYYDLNFGSSISSDFRIKFEKKNFIIWFFIHCLSGINTIISLFILLVEIPYRIIKKKTKLKNNFS